MKNKGKILIIIGIALMIAILLTCVYVFAVYLPRQKEENERERMIREYYAVKLDLYQKENAQRDDYEVDVAFLGDSLTDGYDLAKYYPQYVTSNRGIGGETTHGLEKRLDVSLYDLKPQVAVILIGGNNLDTMFENYERMLVDIKEHLPETKVVVCSLTAMGRDWAHKNKIAAYNNVVIEKLALRYGFEFADLYAPLFNEDLGEIYSEYTNDGVHLTPLGYEVVTDVITPILNALLGEK